MDTENPATFAEPRKCTDDTNAQALGPTGSLGVSCAIGISPQQIEDARRDLTLAALRWQAALDADDAEVS